MYKLEILPVARRDMVDIARYIGVELGNPQAANKLAVELIEAIDTVPLFPYANPAYTPIRPLNHEYRKMAVQNYLVLYWVDEQIKTVTIARVVYAKRDYKQLLF